jgi:hypothetical protein
LTRAPHDRAALRAVGADAGDVDESHLRIQSRQDFGGGEREVIGDARVLRFVHAGGRDAEAEVAGVVAAQLAFDLAIVHQVRHQQVAQFRVLDPGRRAADGRHAFDVVGQHALAQHALADHAGGAEDQDVHGTLI